MTDPKADGRTSVLATLTASVMAEKKTAARALTPVAGERAVLPRTEQMFPNDLPQEVIAQKVGELTRIIDHLTQARDALAGVVEQPVPEAVVDLDAARKAKEREADEKAAERNFNSEFEELKAQAQREAFGVPEDQLLTVGEWTCPTHGKAIEKTSSKTGRLYRGCPDCNQFER
jgi:hypothetical protein